MSKASKITAAMLLATFATLSTPAAQAAMARPGIARPGMVFDHRYNHNQFYPVRGFTTAALPASHAFVQFRGAPFYFNRGVWYRPYGPRFLVIAPPIGIGIPFLPPFYTTVWFGGIPYYYADNTYYTWRPDQREYVVTSPPASPDTGTTAPPASTDLFVYPKNGQSEQQMANDRYECHAWAAAQSGFDPTRELGGVSAAQVAGKGADYYRAESACLEARGYSVK